MIRVSREREKRKGWKRMVIKDSFGTKINVTQAKNGKIIIPIANRVITLSKEDAETFPLYDIDGFDVDSYKAAYK